MKTSSVISFPLFTSRVACGFPSPADDYVEQHLSLDKELIKNKAATFFVRACGDSMSPEICDGDLLIVDRSLEARNNQTILAIIDGEFSAKKLVYTKHSQIILRSTNPLWADIIIGPERDFAVWGVITYVIHKAN